MDADLVNPSVFNVEAILSWYEAAIETMAEVETDQRVLQRIFTDLAWNWDMFMLFPFYYPEFILCHYITQRGWEMIFAAQPRKKKITFSKHIAFFLPITLKKEVWTQENSKNLGINKWNTDLEL